MTSDNQNASDTSRAVATLEEIIRSRRSIRIFDGSPVPEAVIQHSLDMALQAPNSSNLQPWEFLWVRTPELKTELIKACFSQPAAATASELIVCLARTGTWEQTGKDVLAQLEKFQAQGVKIPKAALYYYQKLVPLMYSQGPLDVKGRFKRAVFFFKGINKPIMREPCSQHEMEIWAVKSCSLACENFMLAVRAHGYDTCPMEGFDSARVGKLLNIPSDALINMIISVGRRKPEGVTVPNIRGERSFFVKEV